MASERREREYQPFRQVWSFLPVFYSCELLCSTMVGAPYGHSSDDRRESDNQGNSLPARKHLVAPCARVPTQSRGAPTNGRHQVGPLFCCRGRRRHGTTDLRACRGGGRRPARPPKPKRATSEPITQLLDGSIALAFAVALSRAGTANLPLCQLSTAHTGGGGAHGA